MANTTNFGWETPDDTDLVKDGAAAMRTLGNAIDSSMGDLKGGTTGQILKKTSNTDMDFEWTNNDVGDITAVTAGTGLSGGGTSGDVTLTNTVATTYDAKGDLVVGTGADTFAKLTAGTNGYILIADSAATTGLNYGFPNNNPVINGGMDIWQRGTSVVVGAVACAYTADRWWAGRAGSVAGTTVSRQTTSDTTNLPEIQYAARVQRDSGNTSTAIIYFRQPIENFNSTPYINKKVMMSFYARAGANYSAVSSTLTSTLISGTGTDQTGTSITGEANVATAENNLTTTWQRFTITGTVASSAKQLFVSFQYTPVGTASTNDWFEVTGVQIDLGSTALPFRRSGGTIQGELAACERYFQIITGQMCSGSNTTTVYSGVNFRTQMRTAPTVALSAAMKITDAGADYTQSSASVSVISSRANSQGVEISMPNFTSITAHRPYSTTVTDSQIQFSAEL